ncbi:MAG: hypothetical protein HQK55_06045 [Deltaproteobacteria bacterium]|nr:hypothetical protein [Deltaproteobacteria bacterium]
MAERLEAPVLVTEGEKAADAAQKLFPTFASTTSSGGADAAKCSDWTVLEGRRTVVWPDHDASGKRYAEQVASLVHAAGAVSIQIVNVPSDFPEKWDLADPWPEGWSATRGLKLIESAKPWTPKPEAGTEEPKPNKEPEKIDRKKKEPTQSDILLELAAAAELFHSGDGMAFGTIPEKNHHETWPVRSKGFRQWLTRQYYMATGRASGTQAFEDTLRVLESKAQFDGPQIETFIRVGELNGAVYLDLANDKWEAVKVTADGWKIVSDSPLKFRRPPGMKELPIPKRNDSSWKTLERLLNLESHDDFILVTSWLFGSLRPTGPFPILILSGEQGSGKSSLSRLLKNLIDPSISELRAPPRTEQDLVIGAVSSLILCFDNLSNTPGWLSDAFCRLSTGGTLCTRQLYTDADEVVLNVKRPVLLNGINNVASRHDLMDRAIILTLPAIRPEKRQAEKELIEQFQKAHAEILGSLLSAVSVALKNQSSKCNDNFLPRMADYYQWIISAESALPWQPGQFQSAYAANCQRIVEQSLEGDCVASAIRAFMADKSVWEGTAGELLEKLSDIVSDRVVHSKSWPTAANVLSGRLIRAATFLRTIGIETEVGKRTTGGRRVLRIMTQIIVPIVPIVPTTEDEDCHRDDSDASDDDLQRLSKGNEAENDDAADTWDEASDLEAET